MTAADDNPYGAVPARRHPGSRQPRLLAGAVARIESATTPATLLASVQQVWPHAVGAQLARQAEPVSERNGVIGVACASATWAHELQMMSRELLKHINDALPGPQTITDLRFVSEPS